VGRNILRVDQFFGVGSIISGYQETKDILKRTTYKYVEIDKDNEINEILEIGQSAKKDILIIDMCDKGDNFIKKLTGKFTVVSFDDTEGGARGSDLVINSLSDKPLKRDKYFFGTEYFIIRPEISEYNSRGKNILSHVKNLLICLGGSDPCSVNLMMIDWLEGLDFSGKREWVLGPSVNDKDVIIERLKNLKLDIIPLIDYKDMGRLYFHADLCISAAGFSLYEMACAGLPALTICLYPHQIPTAKKFEEAGATHNLGYYKEIDVSDLKTTLVSFLGDKSQRNYMSRHGKNFVDGLGTERVMAQINKYL